MNKKILFLTGTRAEFGKLKALMRAVEEDHGFECIIFATGMHTLKRYGLTVDEIVKAGFKNIHTYMNQVIGDSMDQILANTIIGLSRYVNEFQPDMIVVHGDRVEAMAGAIVGGLNNILVAHIEGGELSGTIDGVIRHAISKMSHIHFVSNDEAAQRIRQMGEDEDTIYVFGSPDVDIMLSEDLPSIDKVKDYYEIDFKDYAIAILHPVTTETDNTYENARNFVIALVESDRNYVVIYPNNDESSQDILKAYKEISNNSKFKIFPSLRFEYFLTLLKNTQFAIGNSSAGVREAPIYGVPTINVGSRQNDRFSYKSIINVGYGKDEVLEAINKLESLELFEPCYSFGKGDSTSLFMQELRGGEIWKINKQKKFQDLR